MNIAIDIGGVAVERALDYESDNISFDVVFKPAFISTITKFHDLGHTLFFNSFCGAKREEKTREDFRLVDDLVSTIPESNWHFVRKRERKAYICDTIQADVMIDDTLSICIMLKEYGVKHVFWFSDKEFDSRTPLRRLGKSDSLHFSESPSSYGIIQVKNWDEVYQKIINLNLES